MTKGIIYIASGSKYIKQAINSAESVRKYHPNLPITLFTNENPENDIFDNIVHLDYDLTEKGDSILTEEHIVYEKNLFLDADTRVCGDISEIFDILERFQIVAAHNEARSWYHSSIYKKHNINIPESFPEYNTGVLGYTDSSQVRSLFESWSNYHSEFGYNRNQPAFRLALYNSSLRLGTLPPEYNFMTHTVGFASGNVKILHQGSSNEDLSEWEELLNSVPGKKVTTWEKRPCRVVPDSYRTRRYRLGKINREYLIDLLDWTKEKRKTEGYSFLIKNGVNKALQLIKGD